MNNKKVSLIELSTNKGPDAHKFFSGFEDVRMGRWLDNVATLNKIYKLHVITCWTAIPHVY